MLVGLGTDIVEIERLKKSFNFNEKEVSSNKLLERILTVPEQLVFKQRWAASPLRAVSFLATRYAAKEAFSKAMGCGVGQFFSFQDLTVLNEANGQPKLEYSDRLSAWLLDHSSIAFVSMSDEQNYAVATVVLTKVN